MAPKFSSGFVWDAKDKTSIVVKLETVEGITHYTLIRPLGISFLPTWLKETAHTTIDLSGAGSTGDLSLERCQGPVPEAIVVSTPLTLALGDVTPEVFSPHSTV